MASERNTERIIDLLYDELTEEETASLRNELADSADLRAEHDELSMLLGDVRDAMPMVDVPSSLHQSILDVARNAAAEKEEKRRPVPAVASPSRGIWSRISQGKGAQIALVATVLFAGAFVTRFVNLSDNRLEYEPSSSEIASFDLPVAEKQIAAKEMPSPDPTVGGETAEVIEEGNWEQAKAEPEEVADYGRGNADGMVDSLKEELGAALENEKKEVAKDAKPVDRSYRTKKASKKPASKSKRKTNKRDLDQMLNADMFNDNSKSGAQSTRSRTNAPKPDLAVAAAEEPPAEDKAMPSKKKSVYQAPRESISAVEQLYSSGDYGTTIQAANEFVALGSGSQTETARALQLKAQALSKTGRYQEALRVYDSIKKNYPSYQSSSINAARSEVSRKLEESPQTKKKKEKRRAKPKKSYDFADDEADSVEQLAE